MNTEIDSICMWERCKELAKLANVTIVIKGGSGFELTYMGDTPECRLGRLPTVEGLYGFLCGFEHYVALHRMFKRTKKGSYGLS